MTRGEKKSAKWLKVRVYEDAGKKAKVNVNVPLALASLALKWVPKSKLGKLGPELAGIDWNQIISDVKDLEGGKILELEKDGKRIEIWLE